MRTSVKRNTTDHADILVQTEHDHHPRGQEFRIIINSTSIAPGAYEHRTALGRSGHQTSRGILRGYKQMSVQGHNGLFFVGGPSSGQCSGIGMEPYGGGGYYSAYMGGYSRLHGDSFLSRSWMFGPSIYLRDAYIDDDEFVLEFYNQAASNRNLSCYGSVAVK